MITVGIVPILRDNYCYILISPTKKAAIIDPGECAPVEQYCKKYELDVLEILLTHHHDDHSAGVNELKKAFPKLRVTQADSFTSQFELLGDLGTLKTFMTPGHTKVHTCFLIENKLFTGDLLFSLGCGRIFEGTYDQMFESLNAFSLLSDEILVYPGHEYTRANLTFCQKIFQGSNLESAYREFEQNLPSEDLPTIPTTLGEQRALNPFMREKAAVFIKNSSLKAQNAFDFFCELREMKDSF